MSFDVALNAFLPELSIPEHYEPTLIGYKFFERQRNIKNLENVPKMLCKVNKDHSNQILFNDQVIFVYYWSKLLQLTAECF